ncbi:MAG: hypothetical protein JNL88_04905 [Bacteroidia bacterium]|nr:hypothetical protein [Bacteroidia bacterium]
MQKSKADERQELLKLATTVYGQVAEAVSTEENLSLLETDLIRERLRKMYVLVDYLAATSSLSGDPVREEPAETARPAETSATVKMTEESMAASIMATMFNHQQSENKTGESSFNVTEAPSADAAPQETPVNAAAKQDPEMASEDSPAPVLMVKTIEEKTIELRMKEVRASSLYEAPKTLAGNYTAHETLGDKITKSKTDRSLSEKLQQQALADLKLSIGINERFAFINELFSGNQQLYHQSIDRINGLMDYQDARKMLHDELATALNWKTDSQRFLQFDELVRRRFMA